MVKKILLHLFIFFSVAFCNYNINSIYQKGIESYRNDNFNEAIIYFNQILEYNYESEELLYNLGNAYYLTDNIPLSVWAYEKCLKLNPFNEDANFNLKLVNLKVKDRIEIPDPPLPLKAFRLIKNLFSPKDWILIGLILLFFASILFFIRKLFSKSKFISFEKLFYIILIIIILPGSFSIYDSFNINQGIVKSNKVNIYSAPNNSSVILFKINEGLKVDIKGKDSDWIKIKLIDGKEGWIPSKKILIL